MADNKKDTNNDSVKQLSAYKATKLQEINSEISREKTRATVLMTAIRAKRDVLLAQAETSKQKETETKVDTVDTNATQPTLETQKIVEKNNDSAALAEVVAVATPKEDLVATDKADKANKAEKVAKAENAEPVLTEKPVKKAEKAEKTERAEETAENVEAVSSSNANENKQQQSNENVASSDTKKVASTLSTDAKQPQKTATKSTEKSENKAGEKSPAKPHNKPEVKKSIEYENVQEEVLPNGEIRRIYVPPTPVAKPKVQTRVFGQNGYNNGRPMRQNNGTGGYQGSNPNGGYQGNNPGGGYQGSNPNGGYQGNNPSGGGYQGNRPFNNNFNPNGGRPPRPNAMNIAATAPPFPVPKGATKKPPVKTGQNNNAKFDDRNALSKRALFQRGYEGAPKVYIADGTAVVLDEEQIKIRTKKNRNINSSGQIVIEHAIITTDPVSIKVLSDKIGKTATEIIKILFSLSIIKTINENIDFETAELVAEELNITLEYKPDVTFEDTLIAKHDFDDIDELDKLIARPPVVTIMGHVDHGKTSLLDYIRKAHVTSGEAGGITQHIGAYTVSLKGSPITFLDTPGHEAFTSMRARGAQVTDIAVLVVAADDGIMPQTIEAINHAKQAKVPIIVAVNKMDKVAADPDRILQQLSDHEILPEEWGGDTPVVRVSAKTGAGVDELLSNILTLAEIKELRANPNRNARGTIIEARLDKGLGKIATILVQNGTLRVGDNVVAGVCTGKIRAMIDDKGKNIRKAGPSIPVSVTGWDEVPEAGDHIDVVNDEKFAHELADERRIKTAGANNETMSVNLNDLFEKIQKGELKSVKLIIKADVQGSLEAVKQSLSKLSNEEVGIDIIHGGVGTIKESDVLLAETANAIIIGFNVRADIKSKQIAAQKKIDIRYYDVIYNAIEDIEKAVKGLLEPKFKEVILGTAEIREVFRIGGVGTIAGSHVMDGKIMRGSKARLLRDGKVEYTGEIASLRHNKDDVKEMAKNFDCGIMLTNYMDFKQGDIIEAFQMEKIVDED